jgi:Domain of unknown function (DUF4807)
MDLSTAYEKFILIGVNDDGDENDRVKEVMPLGRSFTRRLNRLQWEATHIQYSIACLSTLGGAYHLCNRPKVALALAKSQERVAVMLGSTSLLLRAMVHQAVNLALLGKYKKAEKMFADCSNMARAEGWTNMLSFVSASKKWVDTELSLCHSRSESRNMLEYRPLSASTSGCSSAGKEVDPSTNFEGVEQDSESVTATIFSRSCAVEEVDCDDAGYYGREPLSVNGDGDCDGDGDGDCDGDGDGDNEHKDGRTYTDPAGGTNIPTNDDPLARLDNESRAVSNSRNVRDGKTHGFPVSC